VSDDFLVIEDVEVGFADFRLGPLDMRMDRGEIVCLLGTNGSGKTTLIRAILGIARLLHGSITLEGESVPRRYPAVLGRVGVVPDSPDDLLPEVTGPEFWRYCALLHARQGKETERALHGRALNLAERLNFSDTRTSSGSLSFGNRRKVQLVSALLHEPDLLLLDEPFTGLDFVVSDAFEQLLIEERDRGALILITTHDLNIVDRLADRVVLLRSGRIVLDQSRRDTALPSLRAQVLEAHRRGAAR
jgi:ABC-2 type transport system ATP-binding protein